MHTMMWAELNSAVRDHNFNMKLVLCEAFKKSKLMCEVLIVSQVRLFGERCLAPSHSFVTWHGEDSYGTRGGSARAWLALNLSSTHH